jgi:2-deoxy-D-gluconate 3-dehydrogenase
MFEQTIKQLVDLNDKTALVTGGALGIGKAIAGRLAEVGAAVMIADINLEAARQTVDEIKKMGGKATAIQIDVSHVEDVQRMTQATVDTYGSLDILVNNAGVFPFSDVLKTPEGLWDKVLDINLKGAFFAAQAAAQKMITTGKGGKIINIASIDAFHPTGMLVHYDASKGGMVMMTRSLAFELARHQINVNAVAPGAIQTPGATAGSAAMLAGSDLTPEQIAQAFMQRIPLGRQGDPDDIARVVLFLASHLADYMTGETIVVDGGYLLS